MIASLLKLRYALVVGLLLTGFGAVPEALAGGKLALVIGNAAYQAAPTLSNPANDAADLATALRSAGFEVIERRDADRAAMAEALRDFARRLDGASLALFFYAGHGLQVNGENYLLPVDARIDAASDVRFETIDLNDILGAMAADNRPNIVILDACRDNPFADAIAHGGRSLGGRGLGRIATTGVGTLMVYSTQPNNIALDGAGRNSPFTAALLKYVATPGLEVRQLLSKVRGDVLAATDRKQVPWDNSSLVGDVYLTAPPAAAAPAPAPAVAQPAPQEVAAGDGAELLFWQSVAKADTKAMYDGYLAHYGEHGQFAFLAHERLNELAKAAASAAAAAPPAGAPAAVAAVGGNPATPTECERQMAQAHTGPDGNSLEGVVPVLAVQACEAAVASHPGDPHLDVLLGRAYSAIPDFINANRHYQAGIAQGSPEAMIELGKNYELGRGLLKNGRKAMDLFTQASAKGSTYAVFLIGTLYETGNGVPKDFIKARDYYEKGAELGEVLAVRSLGILYFNGWGVARNYATALHYFEQAAALGNKQAMALISTIYQVGGYGVARSSAKAHEWHAKAVETP